MWEIPNIQQSGFVRNWFHMCIGEPVRGWERRPAARRDGKFLSPTSCGASLARWLRFIWFFSSFLASFLNCLVSNYFGVAIELNWYEWFGQMHRISLKPHSTTNSFEQRTGTFSKHLSVSSPGSASFQGVWERVLDHISWEVTVSLSSDLGPGKAPGNWIYLYLTKCNFLFPRGINECFTEELKASWHSSDHKGHFDELSANQTKTYAFD